MKDFSKNVWKEVAPQQGCQMAFAFQTKNPDLGKFWSVL
jgi:hypothetical protein